MRFIMRALCITSEKPDIIHFDGNKPFLFIKNFTYDLILKTDILSQEPTWSNLL